MARNYGNSRNLIFMYIKIQLASKKYKYLQRYKILCKNPEGIKINLGGQNLNRDK